MHTGFPKRLLLTSDKCPLEIAGRSEFQLQPFRVPTYRATHGKIYLGALYLFGKYTENIQLCNAKIFFQPCRNCLGDSYFLWFRRKKILLLKYHLAVLSARHCGKRPNMSSVVISATSIIVTKDIPSQSDSAPPSPTSRSFDVISAYSEITVTSFPSK